MASQLSERQLTGREETHLVTLEGGFQLQDEAATAFIALQADARVAGFELAIASSFRSFSRQLAIWNGKAAGKRPVYDDQDRALDILALSPAERLRAILRFSAIPGTSRHHWGTDLDVYDAAAVPADYQLQLSLAEVAPGGVFDALHCWLDERMAAGESRGFFRPYALDRGGVAPERWHLSYAPLSTACSGLLTPELLRHCWDCEMGAQRLLLADEICADLPGILAHYVAVPAHWCEPGQ